MRAIRIHQHGGPEVLRLDDVPVPEPGPGEVRVRLAFAGVNFIDTYHRTGFYDPGPLPAGLGKEGAGVVEAVGPGVTELREGDPVCFFAAKGAYAEQVVLPAAQAIPVPDAGHGGDGRPLDLRTAAALPLQGLTAHYLTQTIRPVGPGDTVLVHAAAGGVGLLAVQMAKLSGATVLGTCSTEEKARRVREAGADRAILYTEEDFVAAVHDATGGRGADLVLDGVGRATFEASVRATRVRGHVVLYGQASGEPEPIRPRKLLGSRTLTSASLFDYTTGRRELLDRAEAVFGWYRQGRLEVRVDRVLPLAEARQAHVLLEARETSGKVLLEP
jgi:NADPH2:quinone reductase